MSLHHTSGAASAAPTFDPALWLSAFTEIGGGYALAAGRKLWLVVDQCDPGDLAACMSPLLGSPERQEAVREAIERRQAGWLA